ncbi:DNA repair protein RecO [Chitinilyticum litopenaei]|uniref:DNA repair protein RecO n=1 Tax=Chitinilyticum litopenaei TaxID=1121276 RepID=UPI000412A709|nr:DNA repair protein RecO [Chitinilyticum litopenaei]
MAAKGANRINQQPAFILHQYPYRETSRLLDVFSRDHGRLVIMARGVQRPGSQLRSVLLGYQPLLLDWFGSGEVKTLHAASWQPGIPQLTGTSLLCGMYLNELLQRILPRDTPAAELFADYYELLRTLARAEASLPEQALRCFERTLLQRYGYALAWDCTADGKPVLAGGTYTFTAESGLQLLEAGQAGIAGQTLLDFAADKSLLPAQLAELKQFMRTILNLTLLDGRPLQTRLLLRELARMA